MIASKIKRENTERRIEANLRLRKHKSGLTRMNLRAFAVCCKMIQISTSERAIWDIILAPISMFDIWPNIIALHFLIPLCYNTHPRAPGPISFPLTSNLQSNILTKLNEPRDRTFRLTLPLNFALRSSGTNELSPRSKVMTEPRFGKRERER